jgi:hypothetical protein
MLEADIENGFVRRAEKRGCIALKLRIDGRKGFPDRTIFAPGGNILFIEFKAPGGKVSSQQREWHRKLRAMGFHVYVCWDTESAINILEDHIP